MNTTGVVGEAQSPASWLMCRIGDRLLAVPLDCVVETMRPLPRKAVSGLPEFILGVSLIRGAAVPVIDVAAVMGTPGGPVDRLVTITRDDRVLALAVGAVIGVRTLDEAILHDVPPLLGAVDREVLSAIGSLDSGLLLVLGHARLVPDQVWAQVDGAVPVTAGAAS